MIHFTTKRILTALLFLFSHSLPAANPIITNVFTADPAALVYRDTVYLYTGHDEAPDNNHSCQMKDWLCFSSTNMTDWTPRGLLAEFAGNGNPMHQAIIDFQGRSYFIYHNGGVQPGGGEIKRHRRDADSGCVPPSGTSRSV